MRRRIRERYPKRDNAAYWIELKAMYQQDKQRIGAYLEDRSQLPHEMDVDLLLWLRLRLQDGLLPHPGSVLQQPHHFIEDMRYINTLEYYHELDELIADCDEALERIAKKTHDDISSRTNGYRLR